MGQLRSRRTGDGAIHGGQCDQRTYYFIIQLFYCPPANYTIITMFESHPLGLALPSHHTNKKTSSLPPPGPFLLEKCTFPAKELRHVPKEWPTDCQLRYLAFLQTSGMECGQLRGRAAWGPFARMAKLIPSKNTNQCRMHHKRMLKEHLTPQGILAAHTQLIRQLAPSFRRYMQEAALLGHQQVAETNKRSKLLKSVIIGQPKIHTYADISTPPLEPTKEEEDIVPTDVAYPDQMPNNSAANNRKSEGVYYPFYQTSLSMMGEGFFSSGMPSELVVGQQKRRKWQECHQLFIAWTTKLHSLLLINPLRPQGH